MLHPSPSTTRSRRAAAVLAAAAAVAACGSVLVGIDRAPLEFRIAGPGGAAIVATWEGVIERDDLDVGVVGELTHMGAEPCPVAVYLHDTEPVPTDIPTLTGLPAPALPGELIFEAVLLPPQGGMSFTREIGDYDPDGLFSWPEEFHHFPGDPPTTRRFITIATCASPDIRVDMSVSLGFSRPYRRSTKDGPDDMSAALLWP